ncbi:MAG: 3-methyl-2-oxobutanoate hydroxymethyltransferase [Clostridiales Family XIII bacterium]|jgi:3-methyl-2-oxobutanoate hydroxymethyltransferase|nr:3-methyl-2-oxobutanoate hydroxymethyltransferase [Clostridiales Family XIII bacterium]
MAGKEPQAMPMSTGRKTIYHLQKMKDEGKMISMVGTASCDPLWVAACERAGVDLVRYLGPGESCAGRDESVKWHTRLIRQMAPNICLNAVMQTTKHPDKYTAVEFAGELLTDGADSVMPMAVTNDTLQYMADNWIPVIGHVGCLSGWQVGWFGNYSRVGKTAEDAMTVFRMAYEYQECGMAAMTIELTSREVTDYIAKKLRVPVISVAAGGAADGSELVIYDLLGFQPTSTMPKHAKYYRSYFEDSIEAFKEFDTDIKTKTYPEEKHGWGMDESEFDKFVNTIEQKYPDMK